MAACQFTNVSGALSCFSRATSNDFAEDWAKTVDRICSLAETFSEKWPDSVSWT
jgi:hypothetical protein